MTRAVRIYLLASGAVFALAGVASAVVTEHRLVAFGAALLVLTGTAHSVLGERFILMRLFRRGDLPRLLGDEAFMRRTLRFAWHLATIAWFGAAALLVAAADGTQTGREVSRIVAVTFAASATVSFVVARGRHLSWAAFLAVAVAAWFAA